MRVLPLAQLNNTGCFTAGSDYVCETSTRYSGDVCECDDVNCPKSNNMTCGGRGDCVCGRCQCDNEYQGASCECDPPSSALCTKPGDSQPCSGRGTCSCAGCGCSGTMYRGVFCDTCSSVTTCTGDETCANFDQCVRCVFVVTDSALSRNSNANCSVPCQSIDNIIQVSSVVQIPSDNQAFSCTSPLSGAQCIVMYVFTVTATTRNIYVISNLQGPPAPTGPQTGGITVAIAIVIVVVIVIVVIITIAIVVICCCRNKKKRISQSCSPVTESEYSEAPNKKQEAENVELGQTRQELDQTGQELGQTGQELDKKQEAENDQIQYAAIDFSGQRPIAPPSLETVVYTETVEQFRKARKNRPIPPLPPAKTEEEKEEEKQLAQEAAEITADFKAQVVAILQASKLVYRSLDPEEPVLGTYQKKTFVASFVHAPGGKEILSSEVEAIIKARKLQSTDKGFLMATTDSISGPWLEYLEKHNCHFIGLSCKGGVKKEMLLKKLSLCFPESSSF